MTDNTRNEVDKLLSHIRDNLVQAYSIGIRTGVLIVKQAVASGRNISDPAIDSTCDNMIWGYIKSLDGEKEKDST